MGQTQCPTPLNLPKDVVGAVASARDIGLEEGVDGGESVHQMVDQTDHPQNAPFPKLVEVGGDIAVEQEMLVLLAAVLIHATAGMPVALVAKVQRVMLAIVR